MSDVVTELREMAQGWERTAPQCDLRTLVNAEDEIVALRERVKIKEEEIERLSDRLREHLNSPCICEWEGLGVTHLCGPHQRRVTDAVDAEREACAALAQAYSELSSSARTEVAPTSPPYPSPHHQALQTAPATRQQPQ